MCPRARIGHTSATAAVGRQDTLPGSDQARPTPDEWVAQQLTLHECPESEPTSVDGAAWLIGSFDCNAVAVTKDGRGYVIALYTSSDDPLVLLLRQVVL